MYSFYEMEIGLWYNGTSFFESQAPSSMHF